MQQARAPPLPQAQAQEAQVRWRSRRVQFEENARPEVRDKISTPPWQQVREVRPGEQRVQRGGKSGGVRPAELLR